MSCLNFKKLQCFFEQILNQFWMMLWSSFLHKCLAISFNKFLCDWKQWFLHLPMVALIINFQWLVKNGFDTFHHDKFIFTSLFKRAFVFLSVNFHTSDFFLEIYGHFVNSIRYQSDSSSPTGFLIMWMFVSNYST